MKNILKIEKSWKKSGYAYVSTTEGYHLRKVYEQRFGINRPSINLDTDVFSFDWDGEKAVNIKYEMNYKDVHDKDKETKETLDEILAKKMKETPPTTIIDITKPVKHSKYEEIKLCVENEIPVYLFGPAGSGKNHTLQQIAEDLGLEFYFTNSVQQEFKITGFIDAGGIYHETEFYKAFRDGGLFFLDEMDASIPEVLVLLNAAIANGYFEFPNGKINAHEEFRVVAAGNTMGNGADEQYTGRLQLDQATLDRFALIEFDYDKNIELVLANGNEDLVNFIRDLRSQAYEKGIRATFSYRSIMMVTKLENKLAINTILLIAVLKGLDKDTIRTFDTMSFNGHRSKYHNALKDIQLGA